MSASSEPRPAPKNSYRELIHTLHQRYHREWERAELLEKELSLVRGRWWGPGLAWLLSLARRLRPARNPGPEIPGEPCQPLSEGLGPLAGRVSIIIPFKDRLELLRGCLRSLRASTWRDFEIVLVDNGSTERRTARYLGRVRQRGTARVVGCPGPFNFSRLCNEGAKRASGDHLLFLNNDTEVLTPDWLERMLGLARRPDVGIVGATLLYPDGSIQHAGLFPQPGGRWIHAYRHAPLADARREHDELRRIRVVPAVSGACLMVRRETFEVLGGFNEALPLTYNDVDLCCRAQKQGMLVVVTPHARLLHFECLSRGFSGDTPGSGHLESLDAFPAER
jgi:GT2 family glycosyltransferase